MDEKLKEKLKSRTDRHFNIQGDATYIEHQEITVQSGANFYNGPAPKSRTAKVFKEEEIDEDIDNKTKNQDPSSPAKTCIEKIHAGVIAVHSSGLVEYGYEYAGVYKAIEELKLFDKFSYAEFIDVLKDSGAFKEKELPTSTNIGKIMIKGEFPNWKVADKGYSVTKKILDIGRCFLDAYKAE